MTPADIERLLGLLAVVQDAAHWLTEEQWQSSPALPYDNTQRMVRNRVVMAEGALLDAQKFLEAARDRLA